MADIASDLKNWSTTEGSNAPLGGTIVGAGLDDNFRRLQATVRQDLASKGSDVASTATADVGAVAGFAHDITGTSAITSLGTVSGGIHKVLKFEGALTLTHNATSLILPGGANITTADGDIGWFISEGSGNWRCITYFRAANGAYAIDSSDTARGVIELATQAEIETATDVVRAVTPGRTQYHPGVAKAWVDFNGTGVVATNASHNVASITDNGVGDYTVNFTTSFSSANYCLAGSSDVTINNANAPRAFGVTAKATGSCRVRCSDLAAADEDYAMVSIAFFGDQ
jgi:hypothetical protein